MPLLHRLFSAEIPEPPAWFRPVATGYVALFAILYPLALLTSFHFLFLGPGLGDEFTFRHLAALVDAVANWSLDQRNAIPLMLLLGLITLNATFRGYIVFKGYASYRSQLGTDVPMRELITFGLLNLLNMLFAPALLMALGALAWLCGLNAETGLQAMDHLVGLCATWVQQVPTIVALPRWAAAVATITVWSFAHYWLHRLSHTRRALWLVLHRPHHMTPHLTYATALPVFMSFPLFILLAPPYLLLFGALSRLCYPEPLYMEIIGLHLVTYIAEIFGHSPAVYTEYVRKPWARWLSLAYSQGLHHVLHHSSEIDCERVSNNNTVNIGPGFFFIWDRLFGTYKPLTATPPRLGLHGQPPLVHNPIRLLTAGVAQIAHELWHNRGLLMWWRILTGPSTWSPPVTHDFAIKAHGADTGESKSSQHASVAPARPKAAA
ncbi:MAG: sterol desaturase family protein [Aquabacterium sp.]|nr:sterol desaturase family protein [Aquabacterium sp.]